MAIPPSPHADEAVAGHLILQRVEAWQCASIHGLERLGLFVIKSTEVHLSVSPECQSRSVNAAGHNAASSL